MYIHINGDMMETEERDETRKEPATATGFNVYMVIYIYIYMYTHTHTYTYIYNGDLLKMRRGTKHERRGY